MAEATMKVRRFRYDAGFKVIMCAETDSNIAAAHAYGVPEKYAREWRKQKDRILVSKCTRKGFSGPWTGRFLEIEDELVEFVKKLRADHLPVTTEMLKVKALELARHRAALPRSEFKASRNWISKFMKKKGFSLRRRTGICQKLPEAFEEKLCAFQRYVISLRHKHGYQLGQIANANQAPLYFDMPANTTVEVKGTKQVRVLSTGNEKTQVTAILCCTDDGHKLPPFLTFKCKTLSKASNFPPGVIVRANAKGWMDTDMVVDWIDCVWRKRPETSLGPRAMLVLDAFRCHLHQCFKDKLAACNTELVVIPGGMTSQLQPLDACLNKPVKDRVRVVYNESLASQPFTPSHRLKRALLETVAG